MRGAVCVRPVCNLYSLTKGQSAIRDLFHAKHDRTGNLPLFPGILKLSLAVQATSYDRRELVGEEANAVVAPIHPKAMPVILTTPAEADLWLAGDAPKALELQRSLRDDGLRIVASGEREDGPREDAAPHSGQNPTLLP